MLMIVVVVVAVMITAIMKMAVIQFFIYLHTELNRQRPVTESG
jgi:hypothetical protein